MKIWKDIPGYEGRYQASSLGEIRSLDRIGFFRNRWGQTIARRHAGRVLKIKKSVNNSGYHSNHLGDRNSIMVHRIIAITFLGPPIGDRNHVNHKNFIRTDNRACNLEWISRKENYAHSKKAGRYEKSLKKLHLKNRGENHKLSKLSQKNATKIIERLKGGARPTALSRELGFTYDLVYDIFRKKTWRWLWEKTETTS